MAAVLTGAATADPNKAEPLPDPKTAPQAPAGQFSTNGCCHTHVWGDFLELGPGGFASTQVFCPPGYVVFGGGGSNSSHGSVVLTDSYPLQGSPQGWRVYLKNNGGTTTSIRAYAICGVI